MKTVFQQSADIITDQEQATLNINFHTMSTPRANHSLKQLCDVMKKSHTFTPALAGGFPESFVQRHTYPFGPTQAIEAPWEQLGIGDCLRGLCKRLNYRVPYERAIRQTPKGRGCFRVGPHDPSLSARLARPSLPRGPCRRFSRAAR